VKPAAADGGGWPDRPHNLGRSCAVPKRSVPNGSGAAPSGPIAGLTGSVAKVAAGASSICRFGQGDQNLNRSLEQLKDAGLRVVGLA